MSGSAAGGKHFNDDDKDFLLSFGETFICMYNIFINTRFLGLKMTITGIVMAMLLIVTKTK